MEPWMQKLISDIRDAVGDDKAVHYETVILPNIVMDFYGMLQKSKSGEIVSEEYQMEDKSMKVMLKGIKDSKGKLKVTTAEIL